MGFSTSILMKELSVTAILTKKLYVTSILTKEMSAAKGLDLDERKFLRPKDLNLD